MFPIIKIGYSLDPFLKKIRVHSREIYRAIILNSCNKADPSVVIHRERDSCLGQWSMKLSSGESDGIVIWLHNQAAKIRTSDPPYEEYFIHFLT